MLVTFPGNNINIKVMYGKVVYVYENLHVNDYKKGL